VLIDWFTVAAQIVNFLVLIVLLKRFLWGRLIRSIDDREARVANQLAQAEQKNKEAQSMEAELKAQAVDLENKRYVMLVQARKEADEEKARLTREARTAVNDLEQQWRADLETEQKDFLEKFKARTAGEVAVVIRQALADLASADLQQCAMEAFLRRLQSIDVNALRQLTAKEQVTVLGPLDIPEQVREKMQTILTERLGAVLKLRFEKDPAMSWGIELRGNGRRIAWTPENYMDAIEENVKAVLVRQSEAAEHELVR
jgi:F-type H+-transporting ATPase subunit b